MTPLRDLLALHPLPDLTGGKDERGTLVVVGGPPTCPGAVLLAGTAALRMGSGRVQLVVDPAVSSDLAVAVPEALVTGWDQTGDLPSGVRDQLAAAHAVVVGPGHDHLAEEIVLAIAEAADDAALVLDAGALGACLALPEDVRLVVAPNPREAEALVGPGDEATLALSLSAKLHRPVAVRGAVTVVADDDRAWTFDDAPPGLGTPGSGDVFTGALGALIANGLPAVGALAWAVELHAAAAERLARSTPVGYLAHEIVAQLPHALAAAHQGGS